MNRQAIVGLFTLLGLVALFGILAVIRDLGAGGRYQIGVHFKSAAGLHAGALVYESGVIVGSVAETRLLPDDFTVEVILAINNSVDIPRDSRFLIEAPLTGDSTVEILPPVATQTSTGVIGASPEPAAVALLPRQVLPLEQQPQGSNPATLADLLQEGQGEIHRLDNMLSELEAREPELLNSLQSTLNNVDALSQHGSARLNELADRLDALAGTLQVALGQGGANVIDLTAQLDKAARAGGPEVVRLLAQLNATAVSLNATVDQVKSLASDPALRQNLIQTTKGLAQTATTLAAITENVHAITGDPQTQAQLRDTVANVDAATQKINSLLAQFGATSSVYGVDAGATPAPVPSGKPTPAPAGSAPAMATTTRTAPAALHDRLAGVVQNLIAFQIRLTQMGPYNPHAFTTPILATPDTGPQADFNLILLPHAQTSLLFGANDVGTAQGTGNFVVEQKMGPYVHVGGGMLYSSLGALAQYTPPGLFGVEARVYNQRFPTVDAYGTVTVNKNVQLFGGERDITHSGRRSAFGLQLQF